MSPQVSFIDRGKQWVGCDKDIHNLLSPACFPFYGLYFLCWKNRSKAMFKRPLGKNGASRKGKWYQTSSSAPDR